MVHFQLSSPSVVPFPGAVALLGSGLGLGRGFWVNHACSPTLCYTLLLTCRRRHTNTAFMGLWGDSMASGHWLPCSETYWTGTHSRFTASLLRELCRPDLGPNTLKIIKKHVLYLLDWVCLLQWKQQKSQIKETVRQIYLFFYHYDTLVLFLLSAVWLVVIGNLSIGLPWLSDTIANIELIFEFSNITTSNTWKQCNWDVITYLLLY